MDVDIVEKESHKRPKEGILFKFLLIQKLNRKVFQVSHTQKTENLEQEEGNLLFINHSRKEMRKNGAGKNNWGNFKDDLKDYGVDEPETLEYEEENEDDKGA